MAVPALPANRARGEQETGDARWEAQKRKDSRGVQTMTGHASDRFLLQVNGAHAKKSTGGGQPSVDLRWSAMPKRRSSARRRATSGPKRGAQRDNRDLRQVAKHEWHDAEFDYPRG